MRIEVVGREHASQEVEGEEHRGGVQCPSAEENVEGAALKRAEPSGVGNALPKELEARPGALCSARDKTVGQNRSIHRPGRGA
jgi:hypothetical protein